MKLEDIKLNVEVRIEDMPNLESNVYLMEDVLLSDRGIRISLKRKNLLNDLWDITDEKPENLELVDP
jgi:hypothetical protein